MKEKEDIHHEPTKPTLDGDKLVDLQVYKQPFVKTGAERLADKYKREYPTVLYNTPFSAVPQIMGELPYPYNAYGTTPFNFSGNPGQNPIVQIIKEYKINHDPADIHAMSGLFEDELPTESYYGSSNTTRERRINFSYIRSIFFSDGDGEDVNLSGSKKNSLLRRMKFIQVNPYKNPIDGEKNPYGGLPLDFILYHTCFPIRHEKGQIVCAKHSLGINARIYKYDMINGIEDVDKEKRFYDEVFGIISRGMCPNFPIMYGFYKAKDTGIDFNELRKLANKRTIKKRRKVDSDCFVILTESPTCTFENWYTNQVSGDGAVMKTIRTGYHNDIEWMSVIFQIIIAIYALCRNGILFNIRLLNIFIKDTFQTEIVYWKYIINGVEYFVPNSRYLVMIDVMPEKETLEYLSDNLDEKIISNYLSVLTTIFNSATFTGQGKVLPSAYIIDLLGKIVNNATSLLDKISSPKLIEINAIKDDTKRKAKTDWYFDFLDIFATEIIFNCFGQNYLHKKIGSELTEIDKYNIKDIEGIFIKEEGTMAVYVSGYNSFKFVWVIKQNNDMYSVLIKEGLNIVKKDVSYTRLRNYANADKISNRITIDGNEKEIKVIETYNNLN
jgi:hypothetical protein